MITSQINFTNFKIKKKYPRIRAMLNKITKNKNEVIKSLSKNYKDVFSNALVKKYKKTSNFRIIGMGGSILGANSIYDFLNKKINKNFSFVNNLQAHKNKKIKKNYTNLIISKSGNTIETIINSNLLINKNDKNIFVTENKKNYLHILAEKLKADIVHHNDYIGGRYSVLSEVGMLPAELMGLNSKKFRQFNALIENKKFLNALILNVGSIFYLIKKKKFNSVIINYDEKSDSFFKWYQQLIAESLGKKNKGLLPIISTMPKDNHSVMQLYLDGFKNNFFTFFYVNENNSEKILSSKILNSKKFLKNKNLSQIIYSQKKATENVFNLKKLPFRSFQIKKRDEKTLGELFCFFILETILLGKMLKVDPYNQPAVELIKSETKKILI